MVCRAGSVVFDRISQPEFLTAVAANGEYLCRRLKDLKNPHILDVRGAGLLVGIDLDIPAAEVIVRARSTGLLIINAGEMTLRLAPPLVITREQIDAAVAILGDCLA